MSAISPHVTPAEKPAARYVMVEQDYIIRFCLKNHPLKNKWGRGELLPLAVLEQKFKNYLTLKSDFT